MAKKKREKRSIKTGLPPGSMVHVGEQKVDKTGIDLFEYDQVSVKESVLKSIKEAIPVKQTQKVNWLNITGLHETALFDQIREHFKIHPLVLEDILNTEHRPKFELHDNYLFAVIKMISFDGTQSELVNEQVSFLLGRDHLITFQEYEGDVFDQIRERIRTGKGRIRHESADYLFYALMDVIVDHYFIALESMGEQIDSLEDEIVDNPQQEHIHALHHLKKSLVSFRKSCWPLREVIGEIIRDENDFIDAAVRPYLRDIYDHIIHVIDSIDSSRDIVSGLMDLYMSNISNRMNEVMKVLTIIATIFIPISFLAGVFGMNFEFMPELKWKESYFVFWGVVVSVAGFMLYYFRRKKWL